jgi:hypothetical protein
MYTCVFVYVEGGGDGGVPIEGGKGGHNTCSLLFKGRMADEREGWGVRGLAS